MHTTRGDLPVLNPEPLPTGEALKGPREIAVQHLLVSYRGAKMAPLSVARTKEEAKARAFQAYEKVRNGANFDEMVIEYSDEPGAAERAGSLGRITRKKVVKAFGDAAFKLEPGQVSEVTESDFGFHVIRRLE